MSAAVVLRYAKAVVGATVAGVSVYLAARPGGVTTDEMWGIVAAVLAGGGIVGAVPNKPKP
jgi:hypothetical protein